MQIARTILTSVILLLGTAPAGAADPEPRTHEFEVGGMTCKLCPIRIEKGLETIDGVTSVEADEKTGRVRVVSDARVTSAALAAAIEDAGPFEAKLVAAPGDADRR